MKKGVLYEKVIFSVSDDHSAVLFDEGCELLYVFGVGDEFQNVG